MFGNFFEFFAKLFQNSGAKRVFERSIFPGPAKQQAHRVFNVCPTYVISKITKAKPAEVSLLAV